MSINFHSFITGSRAHGIPRKDSDIDLVVALYEKDYRTLWALSTNGKLQFGNLNIVAFNMSNPEDAKRYEAWRAVNYELCARRQVTKEEACLAYRKAGAESNYVSKQVEGNRETKKVCFSEEELKLLKKFAEFVDPEITESRVDFLLDNFSDVWFQVGK